MFAFGPLSDLGLHHVIVSDCPLSIACHLSTYQQWMHLNITDLEMVQIHSIYPPRGVTVRQVFLSAHRGGPFSELFMGCHKGWVALVVMGLAQRRNVCSRGLDVIAHAAIMWAGRVVAGHTTDVETQTLARLTYKNADRPVPNMTYWGGARPGAWNKRLTQVSVISLYSAVTPSGTRCNTVKYLTECFKAPIRHELLNEESSLTFPASNFLNYVFRRAPM